jgi:hypothetical protein
MRSPANKTLFEAAVVLESNIARDIRIRSDK